MKSFRFFNRVIPVVAAFVVAGCMTIYDAREAQRSFTDLSRDDFTCSRTNRLDLSAYSLSQLVDFAMTNRPSVMHAYLQVEDARLALKQLRADAPLISETPWLSPKVSVSGGYTASSIGSRSVDLITRGGSSGTVALSIPIYDFGRHDAAVASQCESVLEAELNLVNEGYSVFYDVSSSYFSLLEKCAMLAVAYTNETEFALHFERANRMFEAGEATNVDVMRARLDLAQAREKIVTAQSEVDTAGALFLKSLGVDASYGVRRDVLDFPGDPLTFVMRGFPDTDYSVRDAFVLAQTNAPSMRIVRSRLRGASADVDQAVADLLPTITATASLNWADPLWLWGWGVNGVQTVFAGFRKTTAVDRSVLALRQAAAAVEEEELQLSLSIEKSVAQRDTANKALETAAESLRESRANLAVVKEQYLVGDVSRVEYAQAVNTYITSMGNRISAFYAKQRAECAIFSLVGIYPIYEEKKLTEVVK